MSVDVATAQPRSPLAVLWDVVIAPRSAFDAIRARPRWLVAFLVTSALALAGGYLQVPASQHVVASMLAAQSHANSNFASMTPEKQQQVMHFTIALAAWQWLSLPFVVLGAALVTALVLRIGAIAGQAADAEGSRFGSLFALAMNVAVISFGLGYVYFTAVTLLRGADALSTTSDLVRVWPSLAWLVPGAPPKLTVFLGTLNVFALWSALLLALGMERIAGARRIVAACSAGTVTGITVLAATLSAK